MSIESIHHLLRAWNMPRLTTDGHLYELSRNTWVPLIGTARLHDRQVEILKIVRALPWNVYLDYDESPKDWELQGNWIQEGSNRWTVPRDHSSENLLDGYLNPGGWSLYLSSYPLGVSKIPYIFDTTPDDVREFTRSHSIPVLIQAYFDNSEWAIALDPAVVPMTNAA